MATGAGDLRAKLHFQKRVRCDDGHGNVRGDWQTQFTCRARLSPLHGSEAVQGARLEGLQPYAVTIRYSFAAASITTAWRIVDANNPDRSFNITAAATDERRQWIQIMATSGGADG
ncbi:MAG: head-tail adaptor protein [Alphaproteobacteria bacterium]|nr:head-tail adaptor protein [Alphaproteobacteria bacterium]